ncbi:MAG: phosphoribosylamine--glycine ligase [Phycisphaerales bacterium]
MTNRTYNHGSINVLLVGGGGREHALAVALKRSPKLGKLFVTHPGNPGLAGLGIGVDVPVSGKELYRLVQFCDKHDVGLVVIGPEDPLAEGYADALSKRADGGFRAVFGPGKLGAQLEADKGFAKQLMRAASIPTGDGRVFTDYERAVEFYSTRSEPMVVKAAGLAKGKGVVVPSTIEEGLVALEGMMQRLEFGNAGKKVLIEERLQGTEVSVLAVVDGQSILILPPCQDHKRLGEGDAGPNTGGMGAFCPAGTIDDETMRVIETEVFVPIMDALRREEIDFRGVLYAGLMLTPGGPKVLEFNTRFGDPECQPLFELLESDPLELMLAASEGRLDEVDVRFSESHAVCIVLASEGYPQSPRTGDVISGIEDAERVEGVRVYHAGTKVEGGKVVTAGGRVLGVTAVGPDFETARQRAYRGCERIEFRGKQYRRDIGASKAAVSR